jgi:hypothetical protein
MNSKDFDNYKGLVGLGFFVLKINSFNLTHLILLVGLRELSGDEMPNYCSNSKILPIVPYLQPNNSLLTSDFYFLAYSSGCYYIDQSTGKWSSYGLEVINDTSLSYTLCTSNHLTTFASGLEIFPSIINFNYVFANSSFEQNKTIYLTVIILLALYIIFLVWGRCIDRQDLLKIGVTSLIDNNPTHEYFYEIIVLTGNRLNAGTDSKVFYF